MQLQRIGSLITPFETRAQCPRNGRQISPPPLCHAQIDEAFRPGLQGLDGFSHLILLYWMHEATEVALSFIPPFDSTPRGVFATRAPARPNPIALSVVRFDGMEADGRLRVFNLDCINGTVLLDVKPYLATTDSEPEASMGWLAPHATPRARPDR